MEENQEAAFSEFPDIRLVTVSMEVSEGITGDLEVGISDVGHYEAIGMLLSALWKMLGGPDSGDPEDDDEYES